MPDRDRRRHENKSPAKKDDAPGILRIHDFGDEVHLWVEQRVSWKVALEILTELKAPMPSDKADEEGTT